MRPIKKIMLHEAVISEIIGYIYNNDLNVGDRLPSERNLAETLKVSRTVIREVLITLEMNNIIIKKHGSGIFIKSLDQVYLSRFEKDNSELELLSKLKDLAKVRIMIEMTSMFEASKIITSEQLDAIRKQVEEENKYLIEATKANDSILVANIEFEIMFSEIAGNPYILDFHRNINELWKKYHGDLNAYAMPLEDRYNDHLSILDAVRSGKKDLIEKEVCKHINKIINSCEKLED